MKDLDVPALLLEFFMDGFNPSYLWESTCDSFKEALKKSSAARFKPESVDAAIKEVVENDYYRLALRFELVTPEWIYELKKTLEEIRNDTLLGR